MKYKGLCVKKNYPVQGQIWRPMQVCGKRSQPRQSLPVAFANGVESAAATGPGQHTNVHGRCAPCIRANFFTLENKSGGTKEERPRMVPARRAADVILDRCGLILLLLLWCYSLLSFSSLPSQIPVHYNVDGTVDRMGGKATVFLLPGIISAVYLLLSYLITRPRLLNYGVVINEYNAERQYRLAIRLLRIIRLVIVAACFFINYKIIHYRQGSAAQLEWWFLPAFFLLMLLPSFAFIRQSLKEKNDRTKAF